MIEDLPNAILGVFLLVFSAWFAWESTLIVDEQKEKGESNGTIRLERVSMASNSYMLWRYFILNR